MFFSETGRLVQKYVVQLHEDLFEYSSPLSKNQSGHILKLLKRTVRSLKVKCKRKFAYCVSPYHPLTSL